MGGILSSKSDLERASQSAIASVRMRDGVPLAYELIESLSHRHRIVLVHSLAMDMEFWRPVAKLMASDVSILLYDCRGHGNSGKPPGPYSLELFADDLADLLDAIGWDRCHVAGASMGGSVAIAFASIYPRRTLSLGLIDTSAWYGKDAKEQWEARAQLALSKGLAALVEFQVARWFSDPMRSENPEVARRCVNIFLRNDVGSYAETCRMLGDFDLRPALAQLRTPTSIVVGADDQATPVAMARLLHGGIDASTLTIIEGVRHLTPLETPERIAAELGVLFGRSG
jgi:3-oxoadipate enol-lactonase